MLFVNQANFPAEHEVRTNICHHRETENDKKTDSTPAPGTEKHCDDVSIDIW